MSVRLYWNPFAHRLASAPVRPVLALTKSRSTTSQSSSTMAARRMKNPVLFICDIQEKFRSAIHEFPTVVQTATKMLKAASILDMPVLATTQQREKLGATIEELALGSGHRLVCDADKSAFSMWVPEVAEAMAKLGRAPLDCLIVGIETHICVLQTTLDLLAQGHRVWVLQDGVSSCNKEERMVALARLRQEGARVTTSESVIYECIGDSKDDSFRDIVKLVKETNQSTKDGLQALCKI